MCLNRFFRNVLYYRCNQCLMVLFSNETRRDNRPFSFINCIKTVQMIVAKNMCFSLSGGRIGESILENINLTVDKGAYLSIFGAEGSGKSSLLMLLGIFERPTSGELSFLGQDVMTMTDRRIETIRGRGYRLRGESR